MLCKNLAPLSTITGLVRGVEWTGGLTLKIIFTLSNEGCLCQILLPSLQLHVHCGCGGNNSLDIKYILVKV